MLKPKKKILKKEIKKDPVLEKISQAEHLIREKGKTLTYVLIAVVVILVLSVAMLRSKKQANREAAGELGIAQMALATGDVDNAIIQFEALIDKNPGTKSAGMATLMLASANMQKEDFESAELNYRKYIDDYAHDKMMLAAAYNGLAVCFEKSGDLRSAAGYFEDGGDTAPYQFQKAEYYINAVRNYLDVEEINKAEALLSRISKDDLDSKTKAEFEILAARIEVLKG